MGYLLALAAVFFWSFNIIIASYFSGMLSPWELAFGRWFIASLILLPFTFGKFKTCFNQLIKHKWLILWLALSGVVIDNTLIYYAGRTASAVNMGLLNITGPIFLVILSRIFLKTPIFPKQVIGLLIAIVGVLVIILHGDISQLTKLNFVPGDFLMLINTFAFAVYSLLQIKRPQQISQSVMLTATAIVGTIIILPIMLLENTPNSLLQLNAEDLGVILYLGIFNSILAYLAWNISLAQIGNLKAGIIYYLLPIFSGIEAALILGEKIYPSEIAGGALIILGIMLTNMPNNKSARQLK